MVSCNIRLCSAKQIPKIQHSAIPEENESTISQHRTGVKDEETHESKVTKFYWGNVSSCEAEASISSIYEEIFYRKKNLFMVPFTS